MTYNQIILGGNLTRDIEIRYTQSGTAVGSTGIAVNKKFKTQTGEQKEEVMFVDLTFFGRTAEIANQFLRKGSQVLVTGELKLDQWEAQDGTKRSKHQVTVNNMQMIGSKPQDNIDRSEAHNVSGGMNRPTDGAVRETQVTGAGGQTIPVEIDINDDEIPF